MSRHDSQGQISGHTLRSDSELEIAYVLDRAIEPIACPMPQEEQDIWLGRESSIGFAHDVGDHGRHVSLSVALEHNRWLTRDSQTMPMKGSSDIGGEVLQSWDIGGPERGEMHQAPRLDGAGLGEHQYKPS